MLFISHSMLRVYTKKNGVQVVAAELGLALFKIWGFKPPTLIFNKPPSRLFRLRWWETGLPLDLLTACLSQRQPLSSPLHCLYPPPSERNKLLTKRFADHDNTLNSVLHTTEWNAYLATVRITCPCILATVWTVLAHNNPDNHGFWPGALWAHRGVFEMLPGEGYILRFICSCQGDWLLLEAGQLHTQSGLDRSR